MTVCDHCGASATVSATVDGAQFCSSCLTPEGWISTETMLASADALEMALKAARGLSGERSFPRWENALAELNDQLTNKKETR